MKDIQQQLKAIRTLDILPVEERNKLDITCLKNDGFIELNKDTWKIINHYSYLDVKWKDFSPRKKDYWIIELELFSLTRGVRTFVEWEIDDELEICLTDSLVKLREIKFEGKALTRRAIDEIEDEEEGEVTFNGDKYYYSDDDTWAGLFFKNRDDARNKSNSIPLRVYEFESDNGKYLSVESWQSDDEKAEREAFISHSIKSSDIKVLQIGGSI